MKAKVSGLRKSNKCSCVKKRVTRRSCNARRGTFAPLIKKAKPQKKIAVIGTDVDLRTNVDEGYMIAQYDPRKKFTLDSDIKLIQYYPAYIREEMEERGQKIKGAGKRVVDTTVTPREIWSDYMAHKKQIDNFADTKLKNINEIKDPYSAMNLADSIQAYNGVYSNYY